jgi:hypothetical protein
MAFSLNDCIPVELLDEIRMHLRSRGNKAHADYPDNRADEDSVTGALSSNLRKPVTHQVINGQHWRWDVSAKKFVGKGRRAQEPVIGADAILEFRLEDPAGDAITKSLLFQAKKEGSQQNLRYQVIRMENVAAGCSAIIDYSVDGYRALDGAEYLRGTSQKWPTARRDGRPLGDYLAEECVARILYRPFDLRWVWYSGQTRGFVGTPGYPVMRHMLGPARIGLMYMRQVAVEDDYTHVLVCANLADNRAFYSNKGIMSLSPLWVRSESDGLLHSREHSGIVEAAASRLGSDDARKGVWNGKASSPSEMGLATLHLAYAQLYSPRYRVRYESLLRIQYPRVFAPLNAELRTKLIALGADLTALHLLDGKYRYASWNQHGAGTPDPLTRALTEWCESGDREVRKAGERGKAMAPSPKGRGFGRVYINQTAYFDGVPEAVWKFHIGGYQVCHKWLSDRKGSGSGKNRKPGRTLSDEDIAHYHKIVIALNETIRIMGEIDKVIEQHGGWPGAFVTNSVAEPATP